MEKLNINFLKLISVLSATLFASSAFAGGYRLHSKAPVCEPKQHKAYIFGYAGVDLGANYDTIGQFDYLTDRIPIKFDLKNGVTYGGGFGFYSRAFGGSRLEIEASSMTNDVGYLTYNGFSLPANFEIETQTYMFNMLKEIDLGHGVTGYVGGGVGYGTSEMTGDIDTITYNHEDSGFAWQIIAGVDFPISENVALFTQYRFLVLSNSDYTTDFGDFTFRTRHKPASHSVQVGARVSF